MKQQILPLPFPKTTVLSYVGVDDTGSQFFHSPGAYPVFTVDESATVLIYNELTDPHFLPVDPTLDWANPLKLPTPTAPWPSAPYAQAQREVATVTHFHGFESDSGSDGHPRSWVTASGLKGPLFASAQPAPSNNSRVHAFPNAQLRGWKFMHDHAMGITRLNVYAGLSTFAVHVDPADALEARLPPAVPLLLRDASFRRSGEFFFESAASADHPFFVSEQLGNVNLVNGVAWPNWNVTAGLQRVVLCNLADARFYNLSLSNGGVFSVISTGQGYLREVVTRQNTKEQTKESFPLTLVFCCRSWLVLGPGERFEALLDFSAAAVGTRVQLLNSARVPFPNDGSAPSANTRLVMQFSVVAGAPFVAPAPLPSPLSAVEQLEPVLAENQILEPSFDRRRPIVISEDSKLRSPKRRRNRCCCF